VPGRRPAPRWSSAAVSPAPAWLRGPPPSRSRCFGLLPRGLPRRMDGARSLPPPSLRAGCRAHEPAVSEYSCSDGGMRRGLGRRLPVSAVHDRAGLLLSGRLRPLAVRSPRPCRRPAPGRSRWTANCRSVRRCCGIAARSRQSLRTAGYPPRTPPQSAGVHRYRNRSPGRRPLLGCSHWRYAPASWRPSRSASWART
jgi:hypothetical protein